MSIVSGVVPTNAQRIAPHVVGATYLVTNATAFFQNLYVLPRLVASHDIVTNLIWYAPIGTFELAIGLWLLIRAIRPRKVPPTCNRVGVP